MTQKHTERKDKREAPLAVIVLVFLTAIVGCAKGKEEKEIPGANISGIRAPITKILISPLAFDGAIVAVEGLARDVKREISSEQKEAVTTFKLSDPRGNFINVSISGTEVLENDYLIVGGIYRRTKNEIEAEQIEKIPLEETGKE